MRIANELVSRPRTVGVAPSDVAYSGRSGSMIETPTWLMNAIAPSSVIAGERPRLQPRTRSPIVARASVTRRSSQITTVATAARRSLQRALTGESNEADPRGPASFRIARPDPPGEAPRSRLVLAFRRLVAGMGPGGLACLRLRDGLPVDGLVDGRRLVNGRHLVGLRRGGSPGCDGSARGLVDLDVAADERLDA